MNTNHTSGTQLIDMSLGLLPAEESYMISNDDYIQNLDKWKPGKNNILYVTGLSGSGKSTLAKEYAKNHNAIHIEIDIFEYGYDSSGINIIQKCKNKFPDYKKGLESEWKNDDGTEMDEDYIVSLLDKAAKYAVDLCKQNSDKLYIFEGLQIFRRFDTDKLKNEPLIIKGTSMLQSEMRAIEREINRNKNRKLPKKEIDIIKGYIKRHLPMNKKDEKKLGKFKRGLESVISDEYHLIKTSDSYYFKNSDGIIVSKLKYHDYSNGKIKNFNWVLISDVDTHPDFRRKGLASSLINQLYKDITSGNSKKGLYLMVKSDNTNAISVYTKLGFNTLKKQKGSNSSYIIMYKGNGNLDRLSNMNFATD